MSSFVSDWYFRAAVQEYQQDRLHGAIPQRGKDLSEILRIPKKKKTPEDTFHAIICTILSSLSLSQSEHVKQGWELSTSSHSFVLPLTQKEYLIIIIISPKYYETVTASPVGLENDERTFNTVYIHKQVQSPSEDWNPHFEFEFLIILFFCAVQLQNEFIQNGSKNFRFIPIVFPGAKKVNFTLRDERASPFMCC